MTFKVWLVKIIRAVARHERWTPEVIPPLKGGHMFAGGGCDGAGSVSEVRDAPRRCRIRSDVQRALPEGARGQGGLGGPDV